MNGDDLSDAILVLLALVTAISACLITLSAYLGASTP